MKTSFDNITNHNNVTYEYINNNLLVIINNMKHTKGVFMNGPDFKEIKTEMQLCSIKNINCIETFMNNNNMKLFVIIVLTVIIICLLSKI